MAAISGEFSTWLYRNRCYSIEGSLPFELGKSYPRRDGKLVKIIAVHNDQRGYETVMGDDAEAPHLGARYNRPQDRGRATASPGDYSDPYNLLPDFAPGTKNIGEGFFIEVSLMGANKPIVKRELFRRLLILEKQLNDIQDEARRAKGEEERHSAWKAAYNQIFEGGLAQRVQDLCQALEFNFTWADPDMDYDDDVREYIWALTQFVEDKRPFYAA